MGASKGQTAPPPTAALQRGARASELLCRMEGCGMVRREKSGHRFCRWVRAKKEPPALRWSRLPHHRPELRSCWLCLWRCLKTLVVVVVLEDVVVEVVCSACMQCIVARTCHSDTARRSAVPAVRFDCCICRFQSNRSFFPCGKSGRSVGVW